MCPGFSATPLAAFGITPTAVQFEAIQAYIALLLKWNRIASLTGITEPREILERHFGESFFAVGAVPIEKGRLADVGPGAGFPGAAIALLKPEVEVTLIESNGKKAAFLEIVRRELGLKNLAVARTRVEECREVLASADFVTARAFGSYDKLLRLLHNVGLRPTAKVVLWLGRNDAAELSRTRAWTWQAPIQIPGSERRVLLVGSADLSEPPGTS